ncbi:phosphoribosylformylglycinamidine synthase I [candidate division KSB1 bacterium]|nr:phosphoribosylformylglycinamidine synthase I [candidate division KSB1 bacterium]RQW00555.1 MAG: phosphoribosylformylglycinamidine synthase I [candidate division KSB1 bacterium]
MIKVIVLRAAGSNCDVETKYAFDKVGAHADLIHINRLLSGDVKLADYQILAIPGGFTYGDDVSAGKILANQIKFQLAEALQAFHNSGKLVLGICNGFQVLVKAGLLPQVDLARDQDVTLTFNDSGKFEDRWVFLKVNESPCVFTKECKKIVYFPVAHAEGKFVPRNLQVLQQLKDNNQMVFQYTTENGHAPVYPHNPNGSVENIAGICDPSGRVLGLMPHPERHIDPTNHPQWTRLGLADEGDGVSIFRNAVHFFK